MKKLLNRIFNRPKAGASLFKGTRKEAIAEKMRDPIDAYAKKLIGMPLSLLNLELEELQDIYKPMHMERVEIGMKMSLCAVEVQRQMLSEAFGLIGEEVTILVTAEPSNTVHGNVEAIITAMREKGIKPSRMLVDRIKRTIYLLA